MTSVSRDAPVVSICTGETKEKALEAALESAGFAAALAGASKSTLDLAIVVKIATAGPRRAGTEAELVAALVRKLFDANCRNVRVIARGYRGESIEASARRGHSDVTPADAATETVLRDLGGAVGRCRVSRLWAEADFRISFAKNRTDSMDFFAATLANTRGCIVGPLPPAIDEREAVVALAKKVPVHFALLDAWRSADASMGAQEPNRETCTVFASRDAFALDWTAAEKMGLDPALSFLMQAAMRRFGAMRIKRRGNLTEWEPWVNVHPLGLAFANLVRRHTGLWRQLDSNPPAFRKRAPSRASLRRRLA